MVDQHDGKQRDLGDRFRLWVLIAISCFVFIGASLLFPNLAWPFLIALVISIYAIIFLDRDYEGNNRLGTSASDAGRSKTRADAFEPVVIEALQFPAYILDQRGNVIYANKASASAFGSINIGELIFIRFRQPELRHIIEDALQSEQAIQADYHEPLPGDRWFAVEMSPLQVSAAPDAGYHFLLGFHDLTEARRTDQMRSDFIANASHELRTPLASLLGYIETIKGPARKDDVAIDKFTDVMLEQAQRMTRLVNDLLSLSRIEMQSHVRPADTVNLSGVLASVVQSLDGVAVQMGVKITLKDDGGVMVTGDRDELLQVFENLIENACKYGEEGNKVDVVVEKDTQTQNAQSVTVSIRDYGPGIAIEHQHRITERFYRVDVARSREKQGTGLGLAIVKHILNRHGTRLGVESDLGKGAKFYVKLALDSNNINK